MLKYILIFCVVVLPFAENAKILGVFPHPSKSHHILGSALLKELAIRGHEVTMLSPYPSKNPPKNYHDVNLTGMLEWKEKNSGAFSVSTSMMAKFELMKTALTSLGPAVLESDGMKEFMKSNQKFDLVIHNWALIESFLGIGHAVNATTIAFSCIGTSPASSSLTSVSSPYSYVPNAFLSYTDQMTFLQRVVNTLVYLFMEMILNFVHLPYQQYLLSKYFPDAPPLQELMDDVDLILMNSNVATESPRPYLPNMVQIGGFHLQEKQSLPDDLKRVLDNTEHGFIFFSFGSNIRSAQIPSETLDAILKVFSKLKYDILWKYDGELLNKPKNVIISNWLPQRAILEHPKVLAFITHGGLGSTVEAIYYGVPMVCIPLFGDQDKNVGDTVGNGYGVKVEFENMSEKALTSAILEVIEVPKYRNNIKLRSDLYRNQAMNPMDKAVYWIEHVIKHKGAKHLKARASKLPWHQYMLLDVISFIFVIILLGFIVTIFTFKKVLAMCCRNKSIKCNAQTKKVKKN